MIDVDELLQDLTDDQRAAATHVDGPLLIVAGAGSGKTRVIVFRIANLVAYHRVPPYRILAVTFTNKAAGEMKQRIGDGLCKETYDSTLREPLPSDWLKLIDNLRKRLKTHK